MISFCSRLEEKQPFYSLALKAASGAQRVSVKMHLRLPSRSEGSLQFYTIFFSSSSGLQLE
jgi:hypothetical protein